MWSVTIIYHILTLNYLHFGKNKDNHIQIANRES